MTSFCWQCVEDIFNQKGNTNDFFEKFNKPTWVECEGCNEEILVDEQGKRLIKRSELNNVC